MKLSTKSRYGTRMMLDIGLNFNKGPVAIKDIARRQEISEKYLEQIMHLLKVAGLVKSIRGAHGGYILARPVAKITLGEIIYALEGKLSVVECVSSPKTCDRVTTCVTRDIWQEVNKKVSGVFSSITLKDMGERYQNKKQPLNYII